MSVTAVDPPVPVARVKLRDPLRPPMVAEVSVLRKTSEPVSPSCQVTVLFFSALALFNRTVPACRRVLPVKLLLPLAMTTVPVPELLTTSESAPLAPLLTAPLMEMLPVFVLASVSVWAFPLVVTAVPMVSELAEWFVQLWLAATRWVVVPRALTPEITAPAPLFTVMPPAPMVKFDEMEPEIGCP